MNTLKQRFEHILSKPMTRQQFLKHIGLLVLGVVGVTNLLRTFEGNKNQASVSAQAYGSAAYGGDKKSLV